MTFIGWFRHRKSHVWGDWTIVGKRLVGPYGVTEHPVQQRICTDCGLMQRQDLEKPSRHCEASP